MALTADQIQARIDALQKSRDAGVLIVQHGTDRIQYQSFLDMQRALTSLKAQLVAVSGATPRSHVNYIEQRSKGFGHGNGSFVGADWTEND